MGEPDINSWNQSAASRGLRLIAYIAVLAIVGGCEKDDDESDEQAAAIPVEVARPARANIDATYSGTAPIEAFAEATVIAKVAGEVREILAEEGDDVKSGQVLARLDGDRLRLSLQQVEANLRKLERDYQRNLDLRDKGLISAGDFEKIQYEMEALRASRDLARLELDYTEIRAPISGVVSERMVKIGNTIEVGTPVFQVTSLEPLVSYLHVPEREYRRILPQQPVSIEVDALRDTSFAATVARVSPVVDPATGTFKITIEVSDPTRRLKPGMFGRIHIVYDRRENVLQIPRSAIVAEEDTSTVYVIEDGVAHKREIRTGYTNRGRIEVVEGLEGGETIVVLGQTNLREGSTVTVINTESAGDMSAGAAPAVQ